MTRASLPIAAAAAILIAAFPAGVAQAQSGARAPAGQCYEIIPAQGEVQPAILLDRCRGRTWRLVRGAGADFRWSPLERAAAPGLRRDAAAVRARRPAGSDAAGRMCFTFNDRTFCE